MTIEEDDKTYFSCIYYPLFPVLNLPSLSSFKRDPQNYQHVTPACPIAKMMGTVFASSEIVINNEGRMR
jgi:hypothetical protein